SATRCPRGSRTSRWSGSTRGSPWAPTRCSERRSGRPASVSPPSREGNMSDDLRPTLCWGTAEGTALPELIDLAAATGYGAITTTPAMYFAARAAGHSDADLRARLDGHGVGVAVVD